jgi:hypothetical protein
LAAVRIEPRWSTAAVYLYLHLFSYQIHVYPSVS